MSAAQKGNKRPQKKKRTNLLGLASVATDLGEKQVDAEGGVLVGEMLLELGNLVLEHVGGVADTTDDAHATGVGDGGSQLGAGSDVHTSQEDGVVDLEKIGDRGADLLCKRGTTEAVSTLRCAWKASG